MRFPAWLLVIVLLLISGVSGFILSLHMYAAPVDAIDTQRVQEYHYPTTFVDQLKGDPQAGLKIYKQYCVSCHAKNPVLNLNAPLVGDKTEWRLRTRRKNLLQRTLHGVGAMPARGGCFECSDAQIQAAIDYMLK
jgi:cytochrome c5